MATLSEIADEVWEHAERLAHASNGLARLRAEYPEAFDPVEAECLNLAADRAEKAANLALTVYRRLKESLARSEAARSEANKPV